MAKTERDRLIEEISYLNTRRGFNPDRLFEAYKRLNKINVCQNIYEFCPCTMDPAKIQKHWNSSYSALLSLKPKKLALSELKKIDNKVSSIYEEKFLSNVYSYKQLILKAITEVLKD